MANDPKEIKKLLKEIEDIYKRLGERNPWKGTKEAAVDINKLKEDLKEAKDYLDILSDKSSDLVSSFRAINDEVSSSNKLYNVGNKSLGSLTSISEKLRDSQQKISTLTSSQVKRLQDKLKSEQANLLETRKQLREKEASVGLSAKESLLLENISGLLSEQDSSLKSLNSTLQEEYQIRKKFEGSLGITGGILKGMSKIPILGDLIGVQDALEAAKEAAEDGAGRWGTLGAAMKSVGKSLFTSLADPLISIGLLVKGFKMFLELGFQADTQVTNLSKSLASSKEEATILRNRYIEIQNSGGNLLETTQNLVSAQLELADAFGVTRGFTEQQVRDQVLLTKNIGLQGEESAGIQQLAIANGMSARDITGTVIKQTAALARQKGIQLDNKKIIGDVAKVSGQLRLQYANNPELIAKAVVQTQKLGVNLEQAKKAAEALLNFEESISSELSAELLTGKSLNLERARLLALNGDSAAAVEEMAKQIGTAADFSKMNVIQQESLAKAVGMSTDELANSLIARENLNKLGSESRKQIQEQIELARQQGDLDKVRMLETSIGDEVQAQAALERISAQDKFNAAMDKLKSIIGSIVEGPAGSFVDMLGNLLSDSNALKTVFKSIGMIIASISLTKLITGLLSALATSGALAATSAATASALTLGIGALAIAVGIGSIMSALNSAKSDQVASAKSTKADDMISPGGSGGGYGKRTLFGPEGAIQLNDKDTIIAGTDLGINKANDMAMAPAGGFKVSSGGDNRAVVAAINELRQGLAAIANRPINVAIDGEKVIKATTGQNPNTDGDEMRKNSYRIS
jgi:hypothetical protein